MTNDRVLIISRQLGSVVRCRPISVLVMEDESGKDKKIIAVLKNVKEVADLLEAALNEIKHFFEHYKDLEPGKWVKVKEFKGSDVAKEMVMKAIENYKND